MRIPPDAAGWTIPSSMPRLHTHEAHVWRAGVAQWYTDQPGLIDILDSVERERAAHFSFPRDRQQFVAAHGVLRIVLSRYLHVRAAEVSFAAASAGKPRLVAPAGAPAIEFNMSHAADCIVIAVTPATPLGVDVEYWVDDVAAEELASDFFSEPERAELGALRPERQRAAFFALWTRKEALVKATGLGVSEGLAHFDMIADPDAAPRLLADRKCRANEARWSVRDLELGAHYSGALVLEREVTAVHAFTADAASPLFRGH